MRMMDINELKSFSVHESAQGQQISKGVRYAIAPASFPEGF
jgi:hypothetical protein